MRLERDYQPGLARFCRPNTLLREKKHTTVGLTGVYRPSQSGVTSILGSVSDHKRSLCEVSDMVVVFSEVLTVKRLRYSQRCFHTRWSYGTASSTNITDKIWNPSSYVVSIYLSITSTAFLRSYVHRYTSRIVTPASTSSSSLRFSR